MIINILAGIGVLALLIGAFFFVMYMEGVADKRKEKRLEKFYEDDEYDDWWHEQGI